MPARTVDTEMWHDVPSVLRRLYSETVDATNSDMKILGAAGIRGLIEGMCAVKGVVDGPPADGKTARRSNLAGKIDGLVEAGLVLKNNAEHLHSMRLAGNEALHELQQPSSEELTLALDIAEHVMKQVFHIDMKFASLQGLQEKRRSHERNLAKLRKENAKVRKDKGGLGTD